MTGKNKTQPLAAALVEADSNPLNEENSISLDAPDSPVGMGNLSNSVDRPEEATNDILESDT